MKRPPVINVFTHSTIKLVDLAPWFRSRPDYTLYIQTSNDDHGMELIRRTEEFEIHLKRYIAGYPRTLRRVFSEIRAFKDFDKIAAPRLIAYSLELVKNTFLENEWFEIMPRYTFTRKRIERTFGIYLLKV